MAKKVRGISNPLEDLFHDAPAPPDPCREVYLKICCDGEGAPSICYEDAEEFASRMLARMMGKANKKPCGKCPKNKRKSR